MNVNTKIRIPDLREAVRVALHDFKIRQKARDDVRAKERARRLSKNERDEVEQQELF
jgi:hypothetical protein